jgi:predicted nucleic acid-binding protein
MFGRMLVDTDVLIWYMRGNKKALRAIEALDGFSISVVTYIELVQGLRNKAELNTLRNFLQTKSVPVLHVTESISSSAMFLVEQHHFSHSLGFSDALIAATAIGHGLPLLTANAKHYQPVKNLIVKRFLP